MLESLYTGLYEITMAYYEGMVTLHICGAYVPPHPRIFLLMTAEIMKFDGSRGLNRDYIY